MKKISIVLIFSLLLIFGCKQADYKSYSGIYPHLAMYNDEGECGTGAVVPWAGRLWVVTYGPHKPAGSSDKLYEISSDLNQIIRDESIGGTPANRMIHKESEQLFIGPYVIDENRNVHAIPYDVMHGRHTGNARHLLNPEEKIYYATMEEGFYEVDVNDLTVNELYPDGNLLEKKGPVAHHSSTMLEGAHGKGLFSGQGVLVFSNNGESGTASFDNFKIQSGILAEWDGTDWKTVRRNQFVEVTGPGGIYGNPNPETDPIWSTGWDHRSLLLGVRDPKAGWNFYRLPKASHSYDGAHGWNTEWPRIRNVGTSDEPDYLMTMHGMFWKFPASFTAESSMGVRPRSAYLKVIGDFARWNDQLVFGCDDSANKEFRNKRKIKGDIAGAGQSNSNLWFTSFDTPDKLGPTTAEGALYISENIEANQASEPFLFAGWDTRSVWMNNEGEETVDFTFEVDASGNNEWTELKSVSLKPHTASNIAFSNDEKGEWIRVIADKNTTGTVHFYYAQGDSRTIEADKAFDGMADVNEEFTTAGVLWALGDNRKALGILAGEVNNDKFTESGYYELDADMNLVKKDDEKTAKFIRNRMKIPQNVVTIDDASVLIIDDSGRKWRLPKGDEKYTRLTNNSLLRISREVATERDLFSCSGTFYELPAENADGFAKIRPIASHNFRIHDYTSYRGLLVMSGLSKDLPSNDEHVIQSDDGKVALWAGAIDDLWKIGKPVGIGGPWKNTRTKANTPSDPYLIAYYDERELKLSHQSNETVIFKIQAEPVGHGPWMTYKEVSVEKGEEFIYKFPKTFQSRWIRFETNKDCLATAWLTYK